MSREDFVFKPALGSGRAAAILITAPLLPLLLFISKPFGGQLANSFWHYCLLFLLYWFWLPDPGASFRKTATWVNTAVTGLALHGVHALVKLLVLVLLFALLGAEGTKSGFGGAPAGTGPSLGVGFDLLTMVWVSIGEEMWKLAMFLSFVKLFSGGRFYHIVLCAAAAAGLFGLYHGLSFAGMMIALATVPDFLLYAYYRSIMPAIIAHFLTNAVVVLAKGGLYPAVALILCVSAAALLYVAGRALAGRRPGPSRPVGMGLG